MGQIARISIQERCMKREIDVKVRVSSSFWRDTSRRHVRLMKQRKMHHQWKYLHMKSLFA